MKEYHSKSTRNHSFTPNIVCDFEYEAFKDSLKRKGVLDFSDMNMMNVGPEELNLP